MEELLWRYPQHLLNEQLKPLDRQRRSEVGRLDLTFEDSFGRILIVEIKKGVLPRSAMPQIFDCFGAVKKRYPDRTVECMVVANQIPQERRISYEHHNIECVEISQEKFRKLASAVGYELSADAEEQPTVSSIAERPTPSTPTVVRGSKLQANLTWTQERARDVLVEHPATALTMAELKPYMHQKGCTARAYSEAFNRLVDLGVAEATNKNGLKAYRLRGER